MSRGVACVLGAGCALLLSGRPAVAQVHLDVGIGTPPVHARVVVGSPRVYVVERYPVYVPYGRDWRRGRGHWARREREYRRDVRDARREYEKELREAGREYWKEVREARREYERDLRKARRDRWK